MKPWDTETSQNKPKTRQGKRNRVLSASGEIEIKFK